MPEHLDLARQLFQTANEHLNAAGSLLSQPPPSSPRRSDLPVLEPPVGEIADATNPQAKTPAAEVLAEAVAQRTETIGTVGHAAATELAAHVDRHGNVQAERYARMVELARSVHDTQLAQQRLLGEVLAHLTGGGQEA